MSVLIPACVSCPQHAEALECTAPVCCSSASLVSQSLLGPPTRPDMAQAEYKRHTTQAWSPNSCFCSKTNPVIVFAQKLSYFPGYVLTFFHIRVFMSATRPRTKMDGWMDGYNSITDLTVDYYLTPHDGDYSFISKLLVFRLYPTLIHRLRLSKIHTFEVDIFR